MGGLQAGAAAEAGEDTVGDNGACTGWRTVEETGEGKEEDRCTEKEEETGDKTEEEDTAGCKGQKTEGLLLMRDTEAEGPSQELNEGGRLQEAAQELEAAAEEEERDPL